MKRHLQLVVQNDWVMLPLATTENREILHKEYKNNLHGLVFIDENGIGNATILTADDVCLALNESEVTNLDKLGIICDRLFSEIISQQGMA